jgi:hypothetical protein
MKKIRSFLFFSLLFTSLFVIGCKSKEEGIKSFNEGITLLKQKDYDRALELFENSCENDIPEGCYNTAWILEYKKSSFLTRWWYGNSIYTSYLKACNLGYTQACNKAKEYEEYKNGNGFIGFIVILFILTLILYILGKFFKWSTDTASDRASDIASGIDPSDFHHHF